MGLFTLGTLARCTFSQAGKVLTVSSKEAGVSLFLCLGTPLWNKNYVTVDDILRTFNMESDQYRRVAGRTPNAFRTVGIIVLIVSTGTSLRE